MIYTVTDINDKAIVVWDGETWTDPSHPGPKPAGQGPATMSIPVEHPGRFEVGDKVALYAVLYRRESEAKPEVVRLSAVE